MVKIGIIGGSGVYDPELFEDTKTVKVHTPYGRPSAMPVTGKYKGIDMVFLPRHGEGHCINPSEVNFRANVWAMKELGVTHILATSAVGSLKEEYRPGELVLVDQFIDRTTKRQSSFFMGQKVCHISMADPGCNYLRELLASTAKKLKLDVHEKGTCVVIEGPRFSTRAESNVFRSWNADIIGMTMVPEVVLAREAEICYQTIAMVTDYDCWKTDNVVTLDEVLEMMKKNVEKVKKLVSATIPLIGDKDCSCRTALNCALI
ncbi:MAG: S-methyl-5'-thioadenosine phosphorylase [Candidatus Woesearchaeota archaeon]